MATEYRFTVTHPWTVGTIPMVRLAAYMSELAKLLGETEHVHFTALEEGSLHALVRIDEPAVPRVAERARGVVAGDGPGDAMKAAARLDAMLAEDDAAGRLSDRTGTEIIPFPGRDRPAHPAYGPFQQDGTLEGEIVSVRGRGDTVHVILRDGPVEHSGCETTPEIGRALARHFRGEAVRLSGSGTWYRGSDGAWELRRFRIRSFEVLEDTPLTEIAARLRSVPGNEWHHVDDPVGRLLAERYDNDDAQ